MLAIHLPTGAVAAPLAAALSLAQGPSLPVAVSALGAGGALAIAASGVVVALRAP